MTTERKIVEECEVLEGADLAAADMYSVNRDDIVSVGTNTMGWEDELDFDPEGVWLISEPIIYESMECERLRFGLTAEEVKLLGAA